MKLDANNLDSTDQSVMFLKCITSSKSKNKNKDLFNVDFSKIVIFPVYTCSCIRITLPATELCGALRLVSTIYDSSFSVVP